MLVLRYMILSFLLVTGVPCVALGQACPAGTQVGTDCGSYSYAGCCTGNAVTWCQEPGVVCQIDCTTNLNPSHSCCDTSGVGGSCLGLLDCLENCATGDSACAQTCGSSAGPGAISLYNAIIDCLEIACPNASDQVCVDAELNVGGSCNAEFLSCIDDIGGGLACNDTTIQSCVCASDSFCCTTWDSVCAGKVESLGCGSCSASNACGWSDSGGFYDCAATASADPTGVNPMMCGGGGPCTPSCVGKSCGDDGCGGTCGTCSAGLACNSFGQCVAGCTPVCQGKNCGPDGCGGTCGTCSAGQTCDVFGVCQAGCTPNCLGKDCGDDGCGGSCGFCPAGDSCTPNGTCLSNCTGSCFGKDCGDDGCGVSCGTCPSGQICNAFGTCESNCSPSCFGKQCGDDGCGGSCGFCPAGETCNVFGLCESLCTPSCAGKSCGDDGCGGSCGLCSQGETCQAGVCIADCACDGKVCGDDGCGGSCGSCGPGLVCQSGACVDAGSCTPNCVGKVCGDNGCGGTCGACTPPTTCVEATGLCIDPTCEPDCAGKECGPDGCGGVCGECPEGGICTSDYLCEGGSVDATDGANSSDDGGDGAGTTAGTAGTVECPPGTVPKYNGLCVEDETANVGGNAGTEGEQSSGCAAVGVQPGPNRNITWLMFMAGLLLLSVRRQRN